MTPQAASELTDLIMLEDFVARKRALDIWSRRWVATAEVILQESRLHKRASPIVEPMLTAMRRAVAISKIINSFSAFDAPPVLHLEKADDFSGVDADVYVARVFFLRQEPLKL